MNGGADGVTGPGPEEVAGVEQQVYTEPGLIESEIVHVTESAGAAAGSNNVAATLDAETTIVVNPTAIESVVVAALRTDIGGIPKTSADTPSAETPSTIIARSGQPTHDGSIMLSEAAVPFTPTGIVQVQSVVHRSPAQAEINVTDPNRRRMLYKVKFHAHLEDGRLILLEDVGFEANPVESTPVFLDAVSSLDVCRRIMEALSIDSFQADSVAVKVAFNEPGHGFKGRKQYLAQPSDWRAMYTLFNSLRKKTTVYMTFDVRRKLKGIQSLTSEATQLHVLQRQAVKEPRARVRSPMHATGNELTGEPASKRPNPPAPAQVAISSQPSTPPVQAGWTASVSTPITVPPAEPCPNCAGGVLKKIEQRCTLRERLLAQLKTIGELGIGRIGEVDEEVLRCVQQDTVDDIRMLCSQT
eukprot:scpid62112/ scgid8036/ 